MLAVLERVKPDTEALAEYLRAGALGSLDADEVSAGHCNQYGHVQGCDKGNSDYRHPSLKKKKSVYDEPTVNAKLNAYRPLLKDFQKQAKGAIPEYIETSIKDVPKVKVWGSSIKEMLGINAVRSSLINGVEYPVHVEAVMRAGELVPKASLALDYAGRKQNDNAERIYVIIAPFRAEDGSEYNARYSIHKMKQKGMEPKLYFMDCERA